MRYLYVQAGERPFFASWIIGFQLLWAKQSSSQCLPELHSGATFLQIRTDWTWLRDNWYGRNFEDILKWNFWIVQSSYHHWSLIKVDYVHWSLIKDYRLWEKATGCYSEFCSQYSIDLWLKALPRGLKAFSEFAKTCTVQRLLDLWLVYFPSKTCACS